jgi:mannose-6-phosphate isomerase-like protein (cupin superfamily)
VRFCIQSDEESVLFGVERGCEEFEQRLLRFDGPTDEAELGRDDELLYVLEGRGTAIVAGDPVELAAGTAAYVAAGTPWAIESADGLKVLSVRVRDPLPAETTHAVVSFDSADDGVATAGRMFRLLAPCPTATQFVGIIPPGRAPDHFHRYDEVVYVLEGTGALHIDGESAPLRPGSCVHLPATLVHSLENAGPGEMHVLGVFRPAGSPAEAYYPDGTRATVPVA